MVMSFSSLHAYAIALLDEEHCSVTEYVQEIEQSLSTELSGDVCDVHHEFHVLFLLPETTLTTDATLTVTTTITVGESYNFYLQNNILQPPIFLS